MKIESAKVDNYGKLQNRQFHFAPGINGIYGKNESGKSTLHSFLVSMMFGLERQRGRASVNDRYLRYEQWNAPAYYSGSLEFSVGSP